MSEFKINVGNVKNGADDINHVVSRMENIAEQCDSICNGINSEDALRSIKASLRNVIVSVRQDATLTKNMETALKNICQTYEKCENTILNGGSRGVSLSDFGKQISQAIRDAVKGVGFLQAGTKVNISAYDGDPVNMCTGDYVDEVREFSFYNSLQLSFTRYYNSTLLQQAALGIGWQHNYESYLEFDDGEILVHWGDGGIEKFKMGDSGRYISAFGSYDILEKQEDGYLYYKKDEYRYFFNAEGLLIRIYDYCQNTISFEYESQKLKKASDQYSNSIYYEYDENDLLVKVSDSAGRVVSMSYEEGFLTKVVSVTDKISCYDYDVEGRLVKYLDGDMQPLFSIYYDSDNRVIRQEFSDSSSLQYIYSEDSIELIRDDGVGITYYHDEYGRHTRTEYLDSTEEYLYNEKNQRITFRNEKGDEYSRYFDDKGNVISFVTPMGEKTDYIYEKGSKPVATHYCDGTKTEATYYEDGNVKTLCDECGNVTLFDYNKYGQVICITNPDSSKHTFSYDEKGNLAEECDECGHITKYSHDDYGNVKEKVSPTGVHTYFSYSKAGDLLTYTNGEGNTRYYQYNSSHLITKLTDFDGYCEEWFYNKRDFMIKYVDKCGNVTEYEYDSTGNQISVITPNGGKIEKVYDKKNQLIKEISLDGVCTSYEYDATGNCVKYQRGNHVVSFTYDEEGRLIGKTDNNGYSGEVSRNRHGDVLKMQEYGDTQFTYTYDASGRCLKEENIYGETVEYSYDNMGNLTHFKERNGRNVSYEYNSDGTLKKAVYAGGYSAEYKYDADGNIIERKTGDGRTFYFVYDAAGRNTKISDESGASIEFEYDSVGNVIKKKYANGAVFEFGYTPVGKMNYIKNPAGNEVRYVYDSMNQLSCIVSGNISETEAKALLKLEEDNSNLFDETDKCRILRYEYTKGGRIASRTDQSGLKDSYVYDANGDMIQHTFPDKTTVSYAYYVDGKVRSIQYPNLQEMTFDYNSRGQMENAQNGNGSMSFAYDKAGRLIETRDCKENAVSYKWGQANLIHSMTYPNGEMYSYEYDDATLPVKVLTKKGEIVYSYDENGRLISKTMPNGVSEEYEYRTDGRLKKLHLKGNDGRSTYVYNYNQMGLLDEQLVYDAMEQLVEKRGYKYDLLNRLTEIWKNQNLYASYEYDAFGNRVKETRENEVVSYKYNNLNQLVEIHTAVSNETAKITLKYDLKGNLVSEEGQFGTRQYVYNEAGQMIQLISESGVNTYYEYDALGNRISEKCENAQNTDVKYYAYNLTKDHNNILAIERNGEITSFLWDNHLIAQNNNGETSYYQCDYQGSIRKISGEDGSVKCEINYEPFGTNESGEFDAEHPFGYAGMLFDPAINGYHTYARNYRTQWGRFLSRDDDRFMHLINPESLNLYTYCLNNPIAFVDLNGEDCYIFYCPEWKNEAINDQKQLAKQYGYSTDKVHLVPIDSNQDLTNGWNAMGTENGKSVDIDTVLINSHANPYCLGYEGGNDTFSTSDISKLENKNVDNLVLYGCNAGHADHADGNVAATFAEKVNGAPVLASDGTVYSGMTLFNLTKRSFTSKADSHYKEWLPEGSNRKNNGWMVYQYENGKVNTTVVNDKKMNITDMVKELKKYPNKSGVFCGSSGIAHGSSGGHSTGTGRHG